MQIPGGRAFQAVGTIYAKAIEEQQARRLVKLQLSK